MSWVLSIGLNFVKKVDVKWEDTVKSIGKMDLDNYPDEENLNGNNLNFDNKENKSAYFLNKNLSYWNYWIDFY